MEDRRNVRGTAGPQLVRSIVALALALSSPSCASHDDSDDVTRERCEALRDHVIDLRLSSVQQASPLAGLAVAPPSTPGSPPPPLAPEPPIDLAKHRAAMRDALGESFVTSCQDHMTGRQITCALAAKDSATAVACATTSPNVPNAETAAK